MRTRRARRWMGTDMDKQEGNDNEGVKRLTYVSTSALQSRLPELLPCLLEGETVVIRHRGKTIGY